MLELAAMEVVAAPDKSLKEEIVLELPDLFTITYRRLVHPLAAGNVIAAVPVKYHTLAVLSKVTVVLPLCVEILVANAPFISKEELGVFVLIPTIPVEKSP